MDAIIEIYKVKNGYLLKAGDDEENENIYVAKYQSDVTNVVAEILRGEEPAITETHPTSKTPEPEPADIPVPAEEPEDGFDDDDEEPKPKKKPGRRPDVNCRHCGEPNRPWRGKCTSCQNEDWKPGERA